MRNKTSIYPCSNDKFHQAFSNREVTIDGMEIIFDTIYELVPKPLVKKEKSKKRKR